MAELTLPSFFFDREGLAVGAAVVGLDKGLAVGTAVVGLDEGLVVGLSVS